MCKKDPDIIISQVPLPSSWEEPCGPLLPSVPPSSPSSGGAGKGHSHNPALPGVSQCSPSHVPHDVSSLEPSSTGEQGTMTQGDTTVG